MKTKIEVNGYEIEIDEVDGLVSVKAEKDGEIIEEFTINTTEETETETEEDGDDSVKSFDDFEGGEEEDFEGEDETEEGEDELETEEGEDELETEEDETKLESFQSFINKRK